MNPMIELSTALEFARRQRLAVLSTVSPAGEPQSALMGVAVTPDFEIVFDTVRTSRKYGNLCAHARVSLVLGCSSETTIQYEGLAQELDGEDLERYLAEYFAAFPEGPERRNWPGMTYFVVRPKWIRYCDYGPRPPARAEFSF
jgi:pyridoxine/pyridoxamine 5'-phosphate oxidase